MPSTQNQALETPRFRVANRSILLFCFSVLLISIGSVDFENLSQLSETLLQDPSEREPAALLTNYSVFNESSREKAANWTHSHNRKQTPARVAPELVTTCGPGELTGKAGLGSIISKWVPWSQIRTGTICRRVQFETPFVNVNDIRIFLTADRSESDRQNHLTPIIWAEDVRRESFDACVHLKSDFSEDPTYWRERVEILWWAIDIEAELDGERKYIGRFRNELEHNATMCDTIPNITNPHSHTVLIGLNHPGMKYEKSYSYGGTTHTSLESVISWLEEFNSTSSPATHDTTSRNANTTDKISSSDSTSFQVCSRRLYPKTPGKIEDVNADLIALRRNKQYTGLSKIRLGDYGRGCSFVELDLLRLSASDEGSKHLPLVFVQARVNKDDIGPDGKLPLIAAWVEHKEGSGFTVCAKNLARGVHNARHTIQIHWIAIKELSSNEDNRICRQGAVAT